MFSWCVKDTLTVQAITINEEKIRKVPTKRQGKERSCCFSLYRHKDMHRQLVAKETPAQVNPSVDKALEFVKDKP